MICKIEMGIFRDYGHIFRLTRSEDLEQGFVDLLHKAYIWGGKKKEKNGKIIEVSHNTATGSKNKEKIS
jgi:hypothetical protein